MKTKIKILIAEDQAIIRMGLKCILKSQKDFEVIAEASNGREVLDILKDKTPDILLLDLKMPVMDGCETLKVISKRFKDVKVIILSMYDEFEVIIDLFSKGARGFVSKNSHHDILINAIHEVNKDGHSFDKQVSEAMLSGLLKEKSINPLFDEQALTERETILMKEICNGLTNICIADKLKISPHTVNFHKVNIYRKTKSKNVSDLLKYAIKHGMILVS